MFKPLMKLSLVVLTTLFASIASAQQNTTPPVLVDVLTLQDGKTYEDALVYFNLVIPIIESHGLERLSSMEVLQKMAGHAAVSPDIVQIWELRAQDPFSAIFSDPAYLEHVALRDSIFQMDETQLWMSSERLTSE